MNFSKLGKRLFWKWKKYGVEDFGKDNLGSDQSQLE